MASAIKYIACFSLLLVFSACDHNVGEGEGKQTPIDSLSLFNDSIKEKPNNSDLYHHRSTYYVQHGNYAAALEDVKKAIRIDSNKAIYFLTLSNIYFATDKTRDSKAALEKAITVDPKNTEALLKLGELYFLVKKYQEAFDHINNALKIDQHIARAYFMKGMIYKEMKDTLKAISSMITAVEQNQKYYDAFMQLGMLFAEKMDKLSINYFNNALRIKPQSEEVLYAKGKFYQDIGEWDHSITTYTELLHYFPDNKYAHYNLGVINGGAKKDYEMAIKDFDAAIKIDPDYFQAYYGKGTCYELLSDKKDALENYKAALKIKPDYAPALKSINAFGK